MFRGLSNTPKLSPMDEGHKQPDSPDVSPQETYIHMQLIIVEEGVKNVGKRTPSDPMETGCRGKNPSDCRKSVRERLSTYTAKYS